MKHPEEEYLPLDSAEDCFREGWRDAINGRTIPLSKLWEGIEPKVSKEEETCDSD